jgi:hypothetical protein
MRTRYEGQMPAEGDANPRRLYLKEPGWRVGHKTDSEKAYCYMMAPGQDYYHRLLEGEIYFYHGTERLCAECAGRRGLLSHAAKPLREPPETIDLEAAERASEFDLYSPDDASRTS